MPTAVSIQCPACHRKLKVSDPRLLGKKVKCPGCQKPILIPAPVEEDEVELTLVANDDIPTGTGARIVPDEPTFPGPPKSETPPASEIPDFTRPKPTPLPVDEPPTAPLPFEPAPEASGTSSGSASKKLEELRKKRRRGMWKSYLGMAVVLLALGGGVAYIIANNKPSPDKGGSAAIADGSGESSETDANKPYSKPKLEGDPNLVAEFDPTAGEPVQLFMMPSGVNMVLHLRPALLWSDGYDYQVLRASLTEEVTNWIAEKLKEVCRREPSQIEEATIGLILGARGSEPDVCAVVRLKEPAQMSDLIEEFSGTYLYDITERPELRLKVDGTYGYLIHDASTIAICPENLAGELEHWIKTPNYEVTEGMSELLAETDRQRLFTVVGESGDIRRHLNDLFPESSRQSFSQLFGWLGEDLETVSWSAHVEPYLHSEVRLRPSSVVSPTQLRDRITSQLDQLPHQLWKEVCVRMKPQELRFREFIGRLPAMVEAFQQSTVVTSSGRHVDLTTVLPAKAAPNLALAAMFTATEAAQTDFSEPVAVATTNKQPDLPNTVAERMQMKVDAEFARRPLADALQYLCDEVHVNLHVDGDGLKDAGYTKNMPQTFNLGQVPMIQALAKIVNSYQERNKEMVACVDQDKMLITVTTRKFAEAQGLEIFPLPATPDE